MTAAIANRQARIADLAAPPALALLELIPRSPERLTALQLRPGPSEGRILLEVASETLIARFEVEGDADRPVGIPRSVLASMRRRCGDAERLVIDEIDADLGLLGFRAFAADATLAITCPAPGEDLPALPMVPLPEKRSPTAGDAMPLRLDPQLLSQAIAVLRRLGATASVEMTLLDHPTLGAALAIEVAGDEYEQLSGCVQIARRVPAEAR